MKANISFSKFRKFKSTIPGDIVITDEMQAPSVRIIDYNHENLKVQDSVNSIQGLSEIPDGFIRWIDIQGLGDKGLLEAIKAEFKIHPLVMEDVVNIPQRVKADFLEDYLFLVLKMFYKKQQSVYFEEQVSLILGNNYVISFQEKSGDCLDSLRSRIYESKGIIRKMNADYLCYTIADTIFDHYFEYLEYLSENTEKLEEKVSQKPGEEELKDMHELKHTLISLKRELWPTRESINQLIREDTNLIGEKVRFYFRDCHDHIMQTLEITESLKELTTELMNIYLSVQGNRMNEIMKVLTIISTIFIPLSFLAGLYGMNFVNIPELNVEYGYFILVGIMVTIAFLMLLWFRKKGWLGKGRKKSS